MKKKHSKDREGYGQRGIITVMVTLLMVPVIAVTGTLVDVARMRMYSDQAIAVADQFAECILSEYDFQLKELYGLYSVSQDKDMSALKDEMAKNAILAFNPNADSKGLSGFMPYSSADVQFGLEGIAGSGLDNPNVMRSQIGDFMKLRLIQVLERKFDFFEMMDTLDGLKNSAESGGNDNGFKKSREQVSSDAGKCCDQLKEYYEKLKAVKSQEAYIDNASNSHNAFAAELGVVYHCNLYKIAYYMHLTERKNGYGLLEFKESPEEGGDEDGDSTDEEDEEDTDTSDSRNPSNPDSYIPSKAKKILEYIQEEENRSPSGADPDEISSKIAENYTETEFDGLKDDVLESLGKLIEEALSGLKEKANEDAENLQKYIDAVKELNTVTQTTLEKIDSLKSSVETHRENIAKEPDDKVRENMTVEIDGYVDENGNKVEGVQSLIDKKDFIKGINDKLQESVSDAGGVHQGIEELKDHLEELNEYYETLNKRDDEDVVIVETDPDDVDTSPVNISPDYYRFYEDPPEEYKKFWKELDESMQNSGEDSAAKKKQDEAKETQKKIEEEQKKKEEEEAKNLRNIPQDVLENDLGRRITDNNTGGDTKSKGLLDYLFDLDFGGALNDLANKTLCTLYDFNMFSSRVTGKERPDDKDEGEKTADKSGSSDDSESKDGNNDGSGEYTLTNVEISKDVNYLYKAELEYIVAGKQKSKDNWDYVRNIIVGTQTIVNFVSSYRIEPVNAAINAASTAVSAAAGPAAPAVKIVTEGALRLAFAAIVAAFDWQALLNREKIVLFKDSMDDLGQSVLNTLSFINIGGSSDSSSSGDSKSDLEISYENYLAVLLFLCTNSDQLSERMGNLITLNVNQAMKDFDSKDNELTSPLDFKIKETTTAVKGTCSVKADFVIVPERFAELFIKKNKAQKTIELIEGSYFGYSVTRGY